MRLQPATILTREMLTQIAKSKNELSPLPVIGNFDFGHMTPIILLTVGGSAKLIARNNESKLEIIKH
jgi:muramoyltetrapeptide carboxypeptidase LdcA involved in peptidoglycan recycling